MAYTPEGRPMGPLPLAGLIGGALLLAGWLIVSAGFHGLDPDFFWHAKVGELLLAHQPAASIDLFSWTVPGRPWTDHERLGEMAIAWVLAHGGTGPIFLANWGLLALAYGLALRLFMRAANGFFVSAWSALLFCLMLYGVFIPKLQIFSVLGLLVTAGVLQTWWRDGRLSALTMAGYVAWTVLWANMHGGAIAGPASLALVLAVEAIARLSTRDWRPLVSLGALTAIAWLALMLNPLGAGLLAYSVATLLDPQVRAMNGLVNEWRPFAWDLVMNRLLLGWVVALCGLGAIMRRRVPAGMLAFAIGWLFMAFAAYRNLMLGTIASLPLLAAWLAAAREAPPWRQRAAIAIGLGFSLLVGLQQPMIQEGGPRALGYRFPSGHAIAALKRLAAHRHLLNFYAWGGEVIFAAYPDVKVFIDGRQYLYGLALNIDSETMMTTRPGWRTALEHYQIDVVFAPPGADLAEALAKDPAWRLAYDDGSAVVLVRR